MTIREEITKAINTLTESELQQVAEYVSFLRFRSRHRMPKLDEEKLGALYGEYSTKDQELAEEGFEEYNSGLLAEDAK